MRAKTKIKTRPALVIRQSSTGYSLLEVMVTIALASIILMASAPALAAAKRKTEAQKQIDIFARWFSVLHAKSLNQQIDITVSMAKSELLAIDKKSKIVGRKKIPALTKITSSTKDISFYGSGVETPTTVRLTVDDITCVCRLSLRGRITTECP